MDIVGNVQLVAGDSKIIPELVAALKKEGIEAIANPDVLIREYASFGIDEAREITQKASMRPVASERRVFIIVTPGMTSEAQNALLKTLEEPAGNSLFFVVVPTPHQLLPTLRSRAQTLKLAGTGNDVLDTAQFLKAAPQKRLDMLKPLLDKDEDDKRDLAGAIAFLASLERELSTKPQVNAEALEAVYRARKYLGDKGSLHKALLEQVALLI